MSIKILGKQSLIYGFGHILSRLATFLLLPLYTNHFTPREYGIIALFYTMVPLLNIIVRYGMGAAFLKNYVMSNDKDRVAVFTNVLLSLMSTGIPFLIITYLFKDNLSQVMVDKISPISSEIKKLLSEKEYLDKILLEGAEKADKIASKKVKKIQELVGF